MPAEDDVLPDAPTQPTPRWPQATGAGAPRTGEPARVPERFAVGAELGRGGMGYVVAATDTLLDRPVAIKHALLDDAEGVRRFEREAKITAQLAHPAIVPIHDAGVDERGR